MGSLQQSHLVEELKAGATNQDTFPVLVGTQIVNFHEISGGFDITRNQHIVEFIHTVQGVGSPTHPPKSSHVEVHLDDEFFRLHVDSVDEEDNYPDTDYKFIVRADGYMHGEHSFSEALSAPIDKRETRYQENGQ